MSAEENHSGIPTRAIHESYLDMQRSLKAYREATDKGGEIDETHGELQHSVLTFYELLRPYLRSEPAIKDWWEGELPKYNGSGQPPDPDDGKGILQVQENTVVEPLNGQVDDPSHLQSLEDWHTALDMNGSVRLVGIAGHGDSIVAKVHQYEKGLKKMDDWKTDYRRIVEKKESYMGKRRNTRIERVRVPIDRLQRAVRELSEVAAKLGALSEFDASEPRTEIPKELIEDVEEWRQSNIQ